MGGGGESAKTLHLGREEGKHLSLTVLLHDLEELDNDLGGGPDHNLALAALLIGVNKHASSILEDQATIPSQHC